MNDYYLLRRAWERLRSPIDGWLFWLVITLFAMAGDIPEVERLLQVSIDYF